MKQKNDVIFQTIVYVLTVLICLITLYPLVYVISVKMADQNDQPFCALKHPGVQ